MNQADTNSDGVIDNYDNVDPDMLESALNQCDFNGDNQLDTCELFYCLNKYENEWRDENCPGYGHVYCDCPWEAIVCEGAWDCQDIHAISVEIM
jgi:hypothetical protein